MKLIFTLSILVLSCVSFSKDGLLKSQFGLSEEEGMVLLDYLVEKPLTNIKMCGVMGMASFSEDRELIKEIQGKFDGFKIWAKKQIAEKCGE